LAKALFHFIRSHNIPEKSQTKVTILPNLDKSIKFTNLQQLTTNIDAATFSIVFKKTGRDGKGLKLT
jgi:hypothetical protein